MNEQIKELVRQADACYIPRYDMWQMDTETLEKFAELIVRECMTIAQEYDGTKLGGPGLIIAMRIEQHFGVEE